MYSLFRAALFRLDPEQAHALTLNLMRLAGSIPPVRLFLRKIFAGQTLPVHAFGLNFQNPIGLAAGYDKDGLAWRGLASLGFGHIEIGTVTCKPQVGNPPPRLFRLVEDHALINRMGFPGRGVDFVKSQLMGYKPEGLIIGVNIGKNKDTSLEEANEEYAALIRFFAASADFLVINVSSPNTIGLRNLQARHALEVLLFHVGQARKEALAVNSMEKLPILVKLAPDLEINEIDQALEAVQFAGMDGVIAGNTTLARDHLSSPYASESGGLSGAPLFQRSLWMVRHIAKATSGRLPVVAVGGIMNSSDAQAMLDSGATLIQIYTGLVYGGPGLVRQILADLRS
jgi:dihydroorotate dehydrogenase